MNSECCVVIAYCFVILAINSVTGLRGRELVTTFCSLESGSIGGLDGRSLQHLTELISRSGSAGSLSSLSPQDLKDLIFRSGSTDGFDRLSPQDLDDLNSWSSSPGIFDGLSSQQLMGLICSGAGAAGELKLQITTTPFKFSYEHRDLLQMDITFKLPSDVTRGVVSLQYSLTDYRPERTFLIRRPYDETDDPVVRVRDFISSERVYIDVKLFNETGVCLNERISEGRVVKKSLNSSDTKYTYSLICLNGNRCQFGVDLRKKCEEAEIPKKTSFYYIFISSLSIFAIALCVLVILAFIKRCWIKRDAPEILQPRNPFYVNLLFRKECQEVIDDLEQNNYELIY